MQMKLQVVAKRSVHVEMKFVSRGSCGNPVKISKAASGEDVPISMRIQFGILLNEFVD
jgi:hypothetical protein